MAVTLRQRLLGTVLAAVGGGCSVPSAIDPPNSLTVSFDWSPRYPIDLLRVVGGPAGEIALTDRAFRQDGGRYYSDSISIPARGRWPVSATLASPAAGTLATVSTTIDLEPGRLVDLGLVARPNLVGWFPCYPILAQAPIPVIGAPDDTLYLLGLSRRQGEHPPVC